MIFPALLLGAQPASAAALDPASLGLAWGLPFAGLLLSIALLPLLAGRVWHHHYSKIAAGWALLLMVTLVFFR